MGLPPKLRYAFANKRIIGIVICENVPQLALNIAFVFSQNYLKDDGTSGPLAGISAPTVVAFIMSGISIITSILSYCTTREIIHNDELIIIQMDVLSEEIDTKILTLQRKTRAFRQQIAKIVRQHYSTVWMYKPLPVVGGVHLVFSMNVATYISGAKNIDKLATEHATNIKELNRNGKLPEMIAKKAWNLEFLPKIKHIKLNHDPSRRKINDTIVISTGNDDSGNNNVRSLRNGLFRRNDKKGSGFDSFEQNNTNENYGQSFEIESPMSKPNDLNQIKVKSNSIYQERDYDNKVITRRGSDDDDEGDPNAVDDEVIGIKSVENHNNNNNYQYQDGYNNPNNGYNNNNNYYCYHHQNHALFDLYQDLELQYHY